MFCPECGQALTRASAGSPSPENKAGPKPAVADNEAAASPAMLLETANVSTESQATVADNADDKRSAVALLGTANVSTENLPAAEVASVPAPTETATPVKNPSLPASPVSKQGTYEKAREGLQRASTATREALADNVKRVEKIRHVSTVMFEEASYDPSLRFVLVALGLFVVFLVLLLLSKVMG